MSSIQPLRRFFHAAVFSLCSLVVSAGIAHASTCERDHNDCHLTVTTAVVTDPSVFCGSGIPIIEVSISFRCGDELFCGYTAAPRFCGTTNTPVNFSACGYSVTVQPKATKNWSDAHASCGDMTITIQ